MIGFGSTSDYIPSGKEAAKFQKSHDLLSSPRMSQTLKLASGEQISFAQVGDKEGIPAIWFGGPANNRHIIGLYHEMCLDLGIKLICFDRPGRGASTPLRNPKEWTFSSWAAYIDEATDLLGISQFYAIGHSFGCSYILASYSKLQGKILGSLRFLATWAPSNLPCMPTSYALQRSLPTKMFRALTSFSQNPTVSSLAYQLVPCQMGAIGNRESNSIHDPFVREVLDRVSADHLGDSYPAYELDWLLALEVQKPLGYNHKSLKCSIKCWHGMDDSITPLGAAMWMQREMDHFLLFAVEGGTHNIHLDFAIVKALFADIKAEHISRQAAAVKEQTEDVIQQDVHSNQETVVNSTSPPTSPTEANEESLKLPTENIPGMEPSNQVWS
jgi:pimeloyl-ACP methyl ester carboxylesterase